MQRIQARVAHVDDRGEITDLIENETIDSVTVVTFRSGAVRGNHYHKKTTQWNYLVSGSLRFVSQDPGAPMVETVMTPRDLIVTEPNVRHALVALENSELIVFTKGPRAGKEYESDTFRLETPLVPTRAGDAR